MSTPPLADARQLVGGRVYLCNTRVEKVQRRCGDDPPVWDITVCAEIEDARGAMCARATTAYKLEMFSPATLAQQQGIPPPERPLARSSKVRAGWLGWFMPSS